MTSCINFLLSFFSPKRKKKEKERFGKRFSINFNFIKCRPFKKKENFIFFYLVLGGVSCEQHDPHDDRHLQSEHRHGRGGFTSGERF